VVVGVALAASLTAVCAQILKYGWAAPVGDPYSYGKIAHGFLEHGFDKLTRRSAMLYPHLLAAIYAVGGGDFVVQMLHCALHVGTCVLVFVMARHLYNTRTALIAGLIVAVHPMLLRYIPELHTETMLTFLCMLTVWCAIRFDERPTVANGVLLGAVGMVATLTKGVMLPVLFAYGAAWLIRGWRRAAGAPNRFVPVMAMFFTMAILLAPWTYRNYRVSGGKIVLLTPGTPDAFLRGYIFTRLEFATLQKPPYTDAENESNALFRQIARDAGTTWELDEVADDRNNGKYMKRMIVEHPLDTVRKGVVGLFTFWYEMTSLKNSLIPALLAAISWIFAFVGLKRAHTEGRPSWLLWLPIIVMNVFVAALIPLGRYSVPILPLLSILAAFGIDTLIDRVRNRRSAPAYTVPASS
jgi:4-amino-4-deoxy-L-arabinose transferase-like glycosyltransferase